MLNVPGNGLSPSYMADPHYRLQKWGGNLMTNTTDLESNLKGLHERPCRDDPKENLYTNRPASRRAGTARPRHYPTNSSATTKQSRATHPAWTYLNQDQTRWEIPFINPQENTEMKFLNNLNTRILEKDNFVPKV
jgi:hypothetical protein